MCIRDSNDWWIGRWWDIVMYLGFPIMFTVLMLSYFTDLLANVDDPWNPANPHGISIILLFWGVTASLFIGFNKLLISRPVFRNVPEGADVPIDMLPGGEDPYVLIAGEEPPETPLEKGQSRGGKKAIDAEIA